MPSMKMILVVNFIDRERISTLTKEVRWLEADEDLRGVPFLIFANKISTFPTP